MSQEIREPRPLPHRDEGNDAAIVFLHGFSGHIEGTWGEFPELLKADSRLGGWDIFSITYDTNLRLDIPGIWSASPPLDRLAILLTTVADTHFAHYKSLAFVTHSMGGLVLQRALVDNATFAQRVGHIALFGTPSEGLAKASWLKFWKRQIRDLAEGSEFISDLRRRWAESFEKERGFKLLTVAGERDEFVPSPSALNPFAPSERRVVYGNHVEIVKPASADSLSVQLVAGLLTQDAAPAGPWNSARVAVQLRQFQRAIKELWPHRAELDDPTRVMLALALESVGRQEDAIRVLEEGRTEDTDTLGTLAGRLKRRWLAGHRKADAEKALSLYEEALVRSKEAGNWTQAYYHAINAAFLQLAFKRNRDVSRAYATEALEHCSKDGDEWKTATEGEAYLLLGRKAEALERYREVIRANPEPWKARSTYQQAMRIAGLLNDGELAMKIESLFQGVEP